MEYYFKQRLCGHGESHGGSLEVRSVAPLFLVGLYNGGHSPSSNLKVRENVLGVLGPLMKLQFDP